MIFTNEEKALLSLTKAALTKKAVTLDSRADERKLIALAEKQSVLPLLYDVLINQISTDAKQYIQKSAANQVLYYYKLLFEAKYACSLFDAENIPVMILKGAPVSALYPVPEYRRSKDIDILPVHPDDFERAAGVLEKNGWKRIQTADEVHHSGYLRGSLEIELHRRITGLFDNDEINQRLQKIREECAEETVKVNVCGVILPAASFPYQALFLLVHMLQHFLRGGMDLRLLCDWVCLWNSFHTDQDEEKYLQLVQYCRISGFSDLIFTISENDLGLSPCHGNHHAISKETADEVLADILRHSRSSRREGKEMVRMRGNGISDYLREFYHQTRINYPDASRIPVLLPALWMATLMKFIYNNHHVRHVKTGEILKNAGRNSRYMKQLHLFQKED